MFTQSRVALTASATTWAPSKAATASRLRAIGLSTVTVPAGPSDSASFLYVVKAYPPSA